MRNRIEIRRFRLGSMADCEQCDDLHPDSTRERCRQHANAARHTVRFVIEDTTIYAPMETT